MRHRDGPRSVTADCDMTGGLKIFGEARRIVGACEHGDILVVYEEKGIFEAVEIDRLSDLGLETWLVHLQSFLSGDVTSVKSGRYCVDKL